MIYENKYYLEDDVRIVSQKSILGIKYKLERNIGFKYLPIWETIHTKFQDIEKFNSKKQLINNMKMEYEDYLKHQKEMNIDVLS